VSVFSIDPFMTLCMKDEWLFVVDEPPASPDFPAEALEVE
jgi:hypothetical protein